MPSSKQILSRIRKLGPMVRGSLIHNRVRCGKPTCKCARGEVHSAYYLSRRIEGKTRMDHIAKDQVATVRRWKKDTERLEALLEKLTDALMDELKQEKRR
jgi:hypothetical protein